MVTSLLNSPQPSLLPTPLTAHSSFPHPTPQLPHSSPPPSLFPTTLTPPHTPHSPHLSQLTPPSHTPHPTSLTLPHLPHSSPPPSLFPTPLTPTPLTPSSPGLVVHISLVAGVLSVLEPSHRESPIKDSLSRGYQLRQRYGYLEKQRLLLAVVPVGVVPLINVLHNML